MSKFVFTFGSGHVPYGNCFTEVEASTEEEARRIMYDTCGGAWCTSYRSREEAGVEKWGLKEVPFAVVRQGPPCYSECTGATHSAACVHSTRKVAVNG